MTGIESFQESIPYGESIHSKESIPGNELIPRDELGYSNWTTCRLLSQICSDDF